MKTTVTTKRDVIASIQENIKFMKQLQRTTATVTILDLEALVRLAQQGELSRRVFGEASL